MAGLEELAAYLLGDATQKTIAQENPYYGLKQVPDAVTSKLISTVGQSPGKTSTKEALAWGLGSGLVSGLLGAQGDSYQQTLTDRYSNAVMGGTTPEDSGLPPGLFGSAKRAGALWQTQKGLEDRSLKQKTDAQMKADLFGQLAKASTDQERAQILKAGEMFGIKPDKAMPATVGQVQPIAEAAPSGPVTIKQRIMQTAQELRAADPKLTPNQAIETATLMNKGELGGFNKMDETIKSLYGAADTMRTVADQAEQAIAGAGETGGTFAPGGLGDKASYLWSAVSPTESEQRANAAKIGSLGPDILRQNYVKGSGALSENELKAYLASGPSRENSKTTNLALVDKYRQVADWQEEKAQFIEHWRDTFGTSSGIDKAWAEYKKENPLFVKDEKTKQIVANSQRPSAIDWLQTRGVQKEAAPELSGAGMGQAQDGAPPTPPPGYVLTGKRDAQGNWGIKKAK